MWKVVPVREQQLQRVLARWKRNFRLGLAGAEVQVVRVVRDRLVERWKFGIDQQVVMARVWTIRAGWGNAHALQSKINRQLGRNRVAVTETDEIDLGPWS
jgi:hypothetical protein